MKPEHKRQFRDVLPDFVAPCDASPDGPVTFESVTDDDGLPLRWRIGDHGIYRTP